MALVELIEGKNKTLRAMLPSLSAGDQAEAGRELEALESSMEKKRYQISLAPAANPSGEELERARRIVRKKYIKGRRRQERLRKKVQRN